MHFNVALNYKYWNLYLGFDHTIWNDLIISLQTALIILNYIGLIVFLRYIRGNKKSIQHNWYSNTFKIVPGDSWECVIDNYNHDK